MAKTLGGVALPEQILWTDRHSSDGRGYAHLILTDISGAANNAIVVQQAVNTGRIITLECTIDGESVNDWFTQAQVNAINALNGDMALVYDTENYTVAFTERPFFEPIIQYSDLSDESQQYYTGILSLITVQT